MPFKKVGDDNYTGPSGRHFDLAQVKLYYSHGGHFPGQKGDPGNKAAAAHLARKHPKSHPEPVHRAMA